MAVELERLPVLIGAGTHTNRITDPTDAPDALDLIEMVARNAAVDAGDEKLIARLSHIWLINSLSLGASDPIPEVRRRLAGDGAEVRYSTVGGSVPQVLVNRAAELVRTGARPIVLVAGAEALATQKRIARSGVLEGRVELPPLEQRASLWPPMDPDPGLHPVEEAAGLGLPLLVYALIETAIRHAEGLDPQAHRERMAMLMDRYNAVAAKNPDAWFPARRTADELATPSEDNRWVAYPYTRYLCSVMDVDMAAGFIVTDAQTARESGLAPSDVAHVAGWGEGRDIWIVAERPSLADSPGIAESARAALTMAGTDADAITAFDMYSAFPSSVQMALRAIGVSPDDPRQLTLTGGLPYHGGPGNNYVSHAIANALWRVREGNDETVLVEGSGYYITKHGVGIYTSEPPGEIGEPDRAVQARIDATAPRMPVDKAADGAASIVAYTVPFDRERQPGAGIVLFEAGGCRNVGLADDELTQHLLTTDAVGVSVRAQITADGNRVVLE